MKNKFPYRYRVLILLFFLILITFLDRVCVSLVGVRIKAAFHLSNEQFGWVLGAFALAYAVFEIPSGAMGDRIGQRTVFIRIVLWWSLFTALTGATTGLLTLICTRFLFGMGEAGAYPNSSATISRWLPAAETSRGVAALVVGSSTGSAIAPMIIIPIAAAWGWRAPFFVIGLIGLLWVLVCFLWFQNEPAGMKKISCEEKTFIEKNRRFSGHRQQFPWKAAFQSRSMWSLVTAFFCSQWAFYFYIAWMPVYLQEGRHFSENEMKVITSSLFFIGIVGALSTGFISDWLVKKKGLKYGRRFIGVLVMAMMGLLLFATAMVPDNKIAVVCLMISYLFMPANGINGFATCIDIGKNNAGTVAGIMNFSGQVGAFFLAVVFGKIADLTHSYNAPLIVISGVLLAGCSFWFAVDPTKEVDNKLRNPEFSIGF